MSRRFSRSLSKRSVKWRDIDGTVWCLLGQAFMGQQDMAVSITGLPSLRIMRQIHRSYVMLCSDLEIRTVTSCLLPG